MLLPLKHTSSVLYDAVYNRPACEDQLADLEQPMALAKTTPRTATRRTPSFTASSSFLNAWESHNDC